MTDWLIKKYYRYWGRVFRCREMTVWDYYAFIRDPDYLIDKKLTERWKPRPNLTNDEIKRFARDLVGWKDDDDMLKAMSKKKKTTKTDENRIKDFYIWIWVVSRLLQWWLNVMTIPLDMFWDLLKDADVIVDPKNYDPDRHEKTIDSKWLNEMTGWKNKF